MDMTIGRRVDNQCLRRVHDFDGGGVFSSRINNRIPALKGFVSVTDSVNHLVLPHTIFTINKLFFNVYIT